MHPSSLTALTGRFRAAALFGHARSAARPAHDAGGSRSVTPRLFAAVRKLNELNALLTRAPLDGDEGEMLSHVLSHLKKAHRLPVLSRVRQMDEEGGADSADAASGASHLDGTPSEVAVTADAALRGSRREGRRSFAVGGGGGARSPAEEALVS
ncbi:hypothetical protein EMIHUDRAFT_209995 [Emiliania huxleyi CCMP1516]|uniref:Uncharacterized protein n=2 Tax=Emiliania huxleyi TaxID=2903 RepID=A0A0D3J1G2_EMIH1|nr:hypothetical protein EMIHUDRAFT_209995 [Emiliania huxleyi CCMP1516]EOD17347.1 hypothetical protein EMIHUDRAFT_209995 [Emiliania huxleyi CCMP1516]|eukprot:XP_005769776.1 hypothetical protein EMIHUDRAFT_209995 [Emiliania huxleyi CCMP1516]